MVLEGMNAKQMNTQIMRRVYYSYIISIAVHPLLWRGMFLGAAAVLLARWLHVASIIDNFLAIPVGNIPQYVTNAVLNAATHGEIIMLLTLIAAGIIALSSLGHLLKSLHAERLFIHTA